MTNSTATVGIIGGGGYGAGELLRILSRHPRVSIASAVSSSHAGKEVHAVHRHLLGAVQKTFSEKLDHSLFPESAAKVLFLATPAEVSARYMEQHGHELAGWNVIDLSGAFRLADQTVHGAFYREVPFLSQMRSQFAYMLPEARLYPDQQKRWIANPGCLASAAILALMPLKAQLSDAVSIVIDAKTGSSGAGRELKETTHHPFRAANYFAYKPFAHQHEPEIRQALGCGPVSFLAQSLPITRGIFVSAHLHSSAAPWRSQEDLREIYRTFYSEQPFVRMRSDSPQIADVVGTNYVDLAVFADGNRALILAAIDNLGKGMVGTAIENMNLLLGWPPQLGLEFAASLPH